MKNKIFTTPKLKFLYLLLLFFLLLFTCYRFAFLFYFQNEVTPDISNTIQDALMMGLRFDIRLASLLLIPAIIIINLPLNRAFRLNVLNFLYTLIFSLINLLYIIDGGYFSYLKSRLNSTAIQFLKNPLISLEMVYQSYPWPLLLLVFLGTTYLCRLIFTRSIAPRFIGSPLISPQHTRFFGEIIFSLVLALGIYGSLKKYPLRWSQAFDTPSAFASNLSLNPILYMADTYSFRNSEFDKEKVKEYYPLISSYLGIQYPDIEKLNFVRTYPENLEKLKQRPNIVLIVMESLAFFKTGLGGSEVNPTPYLDALARESILFTQFYTPTVATARSIFAALTSLPDTSRVKTSSRNPFAVNQHTIMGEFKNYNKYYFLGGSANWGNIRGVFSFNIPGLVLYEEGSYKSTPVDVWGISDLNLFKESNEKISADYKKYNKPFFAFIQSSGFHRPYTIPSDSDNFIIKGPQEISPTEIKAYGFESFEEYNAMRLQDFALGKFIEMAKKEPWYDNTIFVIFGDHALPHNNAKNISEWKKNMANNFHVPLIIHSPRKFAPQIETKIASELDVMPTIAGLAGIKYKTRSLGRDLFDPNFDNSRYAFSYNWYAPFHLCLMDKEFYFELIPYSDNGKLIKHTNGPEDLNVKDQYPEKYEEMKNIAKGFYETARFLLYHNPKMR